MRAKTYNEVLFDVQGGERFRRKMRFFLSISAIGMLTAYISVIFNIA